MQTSIPPAMLAVFRYVWFLTAGVGLLNVLVWRGRMRGLVDAGTLTEAEASGFIRGAAVALMLPFILLGVIGLVAGWSDPFCGRMISFSDTPSAAASLVMIGAWGALLWWVWLGTGADLLGRIGPALSNRPRYDRRFPPVLVRGAATAMVLVGVAAAVATHVAPPPIGGGCLLDREVPRAAP